MAPAVSAAHIRAKKESAAANMGPSLRRSSSVRGHPASMPSVRKMKSSAPLMRKADEARRPRHPGFCRGRGRPYLSRGGSVASHHEDGTDAAPADARGGSRRQADRTNDSV